MLCGGSGVFFQKTSLPETPENGWLEDYFPIGARPIFRGEQFGSGSVTQDSCLDVVAFI